MSEKLPEHYHYGIRRWSEGYFDVNSLGHVNVHPDRSKHQGDLYALVQSLVQQGIEAPILIRFNGIIRDRIKIITEAFADAIQDFNYRNVHRMAFPIKVNPQRHVVEGVLHAGKEHSLGLEVGSKPELIAVLAMENNPASLLLCNGYKDAEYISLALMASQLGRQTLIIIEQAYELPLVLQVAKELGVETQVGFRMKLSSKGSGKWESSTGEHSKFGLFSHELVASSELLLAEGKGHWLKLLHYHMGSQITAIDSIKNALREGVRVYTELAKQHPSLSYFDVGGGLAVDYDGTKSTADFSMNYTVREYARDIVSEIGDACLNAGLPDPIIVTESGRAVVSHHAVLITEVLDVTSQKENQERLTPPSNHSLLAYLKEMYSTVNIDNCREVFHDVMEIKTQILEEFVYGKLSLQERAFAEKVTKSLVFKIGTLFKDMPEPPEEMQELDDLTRETYFCNFSVFQSLPDSWGISQLFPILPIHRLNEEPGHKAVLADLSCDSDGKIDHFIGKQHVEDFIHLQTYSGQPFYIGIFLVGAYQEILGGLHNLFGDTNAVHAELDELGEWELSHLVEGDTIEEVLNYVQFNTERLKNQLQELIEKAIKSGRLTPGQSARIKKKFKQALESYTYLVE